MTSTPDPRKDWLDHLPAEPRGGAESRVAAAVARAVAREATPWWRSWRGAAAAASIAAAVLLAVEIAPKPPASVPMVEAAALGELTETLAIISSVDADFFGTDD